MSMRVSFLRLKREQANLTQKHVADILGVDQSLICKVERYKAKLSREKAKRLCEILKIDYEDYLKAIENKRYYTVQYIED